MPPKPPYFSHQPAAARRALSLAETLTVVLVLAAMALFLSIVPTGHRPSELSKRLVCASNVKGLGVCLAI